MKKILFTTLFLMLSFFVFSQEEYVDEYKDFTFNMPYGWQIVDNSILKYKTLLGENFNGFTQNISIASEKFNGNMNEYIDFSISGIKKIFPNSKIVKNEQFENTTHQNSWKFVIENNYEIQTRELPLRQYYYVFRQESLYFICIASVLQETSKEIEEMFDTSMQFFKILKKLDTEASSDNLDDNSENETDNNSDNYSADNSDIKEDNSTNTDSENPEKENTDSNSDTE